MDNIDEKFNKVGKVLLVNDDGICLLYTSDAADEE